jgi:hypothetical protein
VNYFHLVFSVPHLLSRSTAGMSRNVLEYDGTAIGRPLPVGRCTLKGAIYSNA